MRKHLVTTTWPIPVTSPRHRPAGPQGNQAEEKAGALPVLPTVLNLKLIMELKSQLAQRSCTGCLPQIRNLSSQGWEKPGLINTHLCPQEQQPLGVLAREGLPRPRGIREAEGTPCPANLPPPKQRPGPAICLGCPGQAPQDHPPTGPGASHGRQGGRVCPRVSSGETARTGRSGRTRMPGTGACPENASACGSPQGPWALERGCLVPGSRKEPDRSAEAGRPRRLASRTVEDHRCR